MSEDDKSTKNRSLPVDWRPPDAWEPFVYRAQVDHVVDGDTLDCTFDLGFELYSTLRVRLLGIDTRELSFVSHSSEEYTRGMVHKEYAARWAREAAESSGREWPFVVKTELDQRGKYGRVLGYVFPRVTEPQSLVRPEQSLNEALLAAFDDVEVY